jgi:hypothetical protein
VKIWIAILTTILAGVVYWDHVQREGRAAERNLGAENGALISEIERLTFDWTKRSCPATDQVLYADVVRRKADLEAREGKGSQGLLNADLMLYDKMSECLKRQSKYLDSLTSVR